MKPKTKGIILTVSTLIIFWGCVAMFCCQACSQIDSATNNNTQTEVY